MATQESTDEWVVAPGASCRTQLDDCDVTTVPPVKMVDAALDG